jgi:hypothetical protein
MSSYDRSAEPNERIECSGVNPPNVVNQGQVIWTNTAGFGILMAISA